MIIMQGPRRGSEHEAGALRNREEKGSANDAGRAFLEKGERRTAQESGGRRKKAEQDDGRQCARGGMACHSGKEGSAEKSCRSWAGGRGTFPQRSRTAGGGSGACRFGRLSAERQGRMSTGKRVRTAPAITDAHGTGLRKRQMPVRRGQAGHGPRGGEKGAFCRSRGRFRQCCPELSGEVRFSSGSFSGSSSVSLSSSAISSGVRRRRRNS